MRIQVHYFASIREQLGKSQEVLEFPQAPSVAEVWACVGGTEPRVLVAVNQEYADFSVALKDGDELAFFPPVTGG